jgi:hypothetical protein
LGEERSPLYLRGGRLGFEGLRKKSSHWGWFEELLELQDLQNNSFFSLGVRKGGLLEMLPFFFLM